MTSEFPIKRLICDPFDNRVRERQLKRGNVTLEQLEEHIKALPDSADNAEEFRVLLGEDPDEEQARA